MKLPRAVATLAAVLLVALSLLLYRMNGDGPLWTAGADFADFRYLAEVFWHVPHDYSLYTDEFARDWGHYLTFIPLRGIAVGSYVLLLRSLIPGDDMLLGTIVPLSLQCLQFIACLLFFRAWRRYGDITALLCLGLLIFPSDLWRLTNQTSLAEPFLRIGFVLMLALLPAMEKSPAGFMRGAVLWLLACIVCAQLKSQWALLPVLLMPALLLACRRWQVSIPGRGMLMLLALAAPLSVLLVNGLVWHDPTLSPGIGLHVNHKTNGRYLRDLCARGDPAIAPMCGRGERSVWWRVYTGPEATADTFRAFDAAALPYALQSSRGVRLGLYHGLQHASNFPWPPYNRWLAVRLLDMLTWVIFFLGLLHGKTRLAASMGLALWLLPALGNIVARYDLRYHQMLAGIPLVLALYIAAVWWEEKRKRKMEHGG